MHSHGLTAGTQVAWANIGIGVTHVVTMHDVFRPGQVAGLAGRAKLWILRRLLQRVDALVAVSSDVRANLLAYLPKLRRGTGRIVSILNGIDTQRFADTSVQAPYSIRERLDLGSNVILVGFLGRFMEQKGFLPLLDALRGLVADPPTAPFHLVALGSGDFEREYRLEVQRRGLAAKVSFLEFVPDVGPILRQLDLLVMPSLWEACPLLPMEAMALGVPVLGSDCIGLREVLRGTPSIMVPAGDARAWCQALREAIARPWRDAARAYAQGACKRFDVARSAERLRQLFDQLLCESRPRAAAAALTRISERRTLAVPK